MNNRKVNIGRRTVHPVKLVFIPFLIFLVSTTNVNAFIQSSLINQSETPVGSPPVILQTGIVGSTTIYANNTSAMSTIIAAKNIEEHVDNNSSNVDNSIGFGTHSNFSAQQYGPDSINDVLTEQRFSNINSDPKYAVTGSSSEITGVPDENYLAVGKSGTCEVTDYQGGTGEINQVHFNITYYGTVSGTLDWAYQLDEGGWSSIEDLLEGGSASSPLTRTYNATSLRASWTWENLNTTDIQFQNNDNAGPQTAYVDSIYVTVVGPNYKLDLEVQWTDVGYDETNEELCIYAHQGNNTHSFDATGGYMIVGDGTPDWGSSTGTISFWIKWDIFGTGPIRPKPWGQHDNMEMSVSTYIIEEGVQNRLWVDWGSTITIESNTNFETNVWYFIAIVWNENTDNLFLYVGDENNAPMEDTHISTWTNTVSTVGVTENNFMNSRASSVPTDGYGDDLRYWSINRSLAEIQSDYKNELTGFETNLKSYFKLNNNFNDLGPNNNDGSGSGSYSFSSDVSFEAPSTENIRVDVWNGAAWQNLFTDLTEGWNNISVSSYLTSPTFTIRFEGSLETGDTTQETWNIDTSILHVWTTTSNYDRVIKVNNTIQESWQIRLKQYSYSNIDRLQNCTIYFHNSTDGVTSQLIIENGEFNQGDGPWYTLPSTETTYIAIKGEANSTSTSNVYAYLEILNSTTTSTYIQYVVVFKIK